MARTYAPTVHTRRYFAEKAVRSWPGHRPPPQSVLDAAADRQIDAGWTYRQRRNVCGQCFTALSTAGACSCPADGVVTARIPHQKWLDRI